MMGIQNCWFIILGAVILLYNIDKVTASPIDCVDDADCSSKVGDSSVCVYGTCSNPYQEGCLYQSLPGWTKKRVCNSEDPPDAAELGYCRQPDMDYLEIRIYGLNWESAMFEAWLLQIVLSELLDVPATIETGTPEARLNFYHPQNPFEYGVSTHLESFATAMQPDIGLDCRLVNKEPDNYTSCSHFVPELWDGNALEFQQKVEEGEVDPLQSLGVIGREGWFVPKFTALTDPSVLSYLGLQGRDNTVKNRRKLADLFRHPTTWKEYCDEVSLDGCSKDDGVAKRAPKDEEEYERLYVEGEYTGHFRVTEESDCNLNPDTCTGVLIDFPCDWSSHSEALLHHLDIPLRAYVSPTYGHMIEIWSAANATKSDLMIMWWSPDYTYQMFQGTDMEMMRVTLPSPTQECIQERLAVEKSCDDIVPNYGDKIGACDEPPTILKTAVIRDLHELSYGPRVPEPIRSPAYDAMSLFSITTLQLDQLFANWKVMKTPRDAVCQWAVDNIDFMHSLVPHTYPRALQENTVFGPLRCVAIGLGFLVVAVVLVAFGKVYQLRNKRVIRVAQIEFLYLLLSGSLAIAIGTVIDAFPPTNSSCVATMWLINFGYTLELVPLIVKIAAINQLIHAAEQMRRVVLKREQLFGALILISGIVVTYLAVWTAVDRPKKSPEYMLTESIIDDATLVQVSYFCSSENNIWRLLAVGWNLVLLLSATVLAFQSRNIRQDFNESQTLGILIYSHFVFVVLRTVTFFLPLQQSELTLFRGIIFSVDTLATIIIYFVPKFLTPEDSSQTSRSYGSAPFTNNSNRNIRSFDHQSGKSSDDLETARRLKFRNTSEISADGQSRPLEESHMSKMVRLEQENGELQSKIALLQEKFAGLTVPENGESYVSKMRRLEQENAELHSKISLLQEGQFTGLAERESDNLGRPEAFANEDEITSKNTSD